MTKNPPDGLRPVRRRWGGSPPLASTYVFDPTASRREYEAEREREVEEARAAVGRAQAAAATATTRQATIKGHMQDGAMPYVEWSAQDAELAEQEATATRQAEIDRRRLDALLAPEDASYEDWQSLRETALGDLTKDTDPRPASGRTATDL